MALKSSFRATHGSQLRRQNVRQGVTPDIYCSAASTVLAIEAHVRQSSI